MSGIQNFLYLSNLVKIKFCLILFLCDMIFLVRRNKNIGGELKMKKILFLLVILVGFSSINVTNTQANSTEEPISVTAAYSQKIIPIYDKLIDTQYNCSNGSTLKREYREKKYILEKYNSAGKIVSSQTIVENYFTPYKFYSSGCRIQSFKK